jgi:hypothetical protein
MYKCKYLIGMDYNTTLFGATKKALGMDKLLKYEFEKIEKRQRSLIHVERTKVTRMD